MIRKETVFLKYKDDDDENREGFFTLIEINPSYITFETLSPHSKNQITIPIHRLIKMKKKEEGENE